MIIAIDSSICFMLHCLEVIYLLSIESRIYSVSQLVYYSNDSNCRNKNCIRYQSNKCEQLQRFFHSRNILYLFFLYYYYRERFVFTLQRSIEIKEVGGPKKFWIFLGGGGGRGGGLRGGYIFTISFFYDTSQLIGTQQQAYVTLCKQWIKCVIIRFIKEQNNGDTNSNTYYNNYRFVYV